MAQIFTIGPFDSRLHENLVNAPDYKVYDIIYENTSVFSKLLLSIRQLNIDHDPVSIL